MTTPGRPWTATAGTINSNFHLLSPPVLFAGPLCGTIRITNDGGYWEGTWTGHRDESTGYLYFTCVAFGGGGYHGLQLRVEGERLSPDPAAPETWHGYILDPGS